MIRLSSMLPLRQWIICVAVLLVQFAENRAQTFAAKDRQPTPDELSKLPAVVPEKAAELIKLVQAPPEFDVTIFATPPAVNYPVFVAAAPDGTLYVSSDGNGSIDRKPHMGRILRVRDTDGDGQADEVKAFVPDVDSPRGLVWDYNRLYLLHPPDVSVFIDHDHDGVADEKMTLIAGIGWTFKDRPADHGSNGLTLGIDGWLYAAIGDFGFMEATGTDGRKLQMRGGGMVRFRPDGTGLEAFAEGTRNILEVAMNPLLDGFARDNTNDGGGWDVRFHHFSGFTQHGYPRLFKNFADEIIAPLADYGGGSGCGAAWIDEPGIPAKWNNAPFTADWGTERVYHHGLTPQGATFTATQEEFLRLPRVTDLDVDANSAIYAASWKGASFTWVGPDVGFIVKLTPKGFKPELLPDFEKANDPELLKQLESSSHRRRLEAQRALLRRGRLGLIDPILAKRYGLVSPWNEAISMAEDSSKPTAARVAALFAIAQATNGALGTAASSQITTNQSEVLGKLALSPQMAPWAFRALADSERLLKATSAATLLSGLNSTNALTRRETALALGQLGAGAHGASITPLLADLDPVVAHAAVQSLIRLKASDACLAILDKGAAASKLRSGALRVLQSLQEPSVVDKLITHLEHEPNSEQRPGLITALCRLHFKEGTWKGDSWGTRPDTRGPYYQPEPWSETSKIAAVLKSALDKADANEAAFIGRELARHRIPAGDALDKLIARAATEPTLLPAIAAQLAETEEVPANAIPLLIQTATADATADAPRAQAVIALAKTESSDAWRAVMTALPRVQKTKTENNLAEKARNAVNNASKLDQVHAVFEEAAARLDGQSSLLAEGMLLKLSSRKIGSPEAREAAARSLDSGWVEPKRRVQILRAAAEVRDSSRAAQFVAALEDTDSEVAKAAHETVKRLKIDPEKFRAEAGAAKVGDLSLDAVLAKIQESKGEVSRGEQLFTQIGCNGCHTVKADEPLKGPFLGTIAKIYKRRELAEAILLPSKTIAQGFAANHFELKDGSEVDGFVVREAADAVTVRTITAQEQTIPVAQIMKREKQERSLMPEGLAAGLTVKDLASLLEYLEGLSK
ncbi:MAG: heme-binding domain-containing protein [Pedosphaera sp.]|nr:heme-binding domain-containing protein [Pedosphaera sp.]